jgi:hypothetical protein
MLRANAVPNGIGILGILVHSGESEAPQYSFVKEHSAQLRAEQPSILYGGVARPVAAGAARDRQNRDWRQRPGKKILI